jgi:hypothetical protein
MRYLVIKNQYYSEHDKKHHHHREVVKQDLHMAHLLCYSNIVLWLSRCKPPLCSTFYESFSAAASAIISFINQEVYKIGFVRKKTSLTLTWKQYIIVPQIWSCSSNICTCYKHMYIVQRGASLDLRCTWDPKTPQLSPRSAKCSWTKDMSSKQHKLKWSKKQEMCKLCVCGSEECLWQPTTIFPLLLSR